MSSAFAAAVDALRTRRAQVRGTISRAIGGALGFALGLNDAAVHAGILRTCGAQVSLAVGFALAFDDDVAARRHGLGRT